MYAFPPRTEELRHKKVKETMLATASLVDLVVGQAMTSWEAWFHPGVLCESFFLTNRLNSIKQYGHGYLANYCLH